MIGQILYDPISYRQLAMASESQQQSGEPVEQIIDEASEWTNIDVEPHRFNAVEFNLGAHEIGHVHRMGSLDINYPKRMRDTLIDEGRTGEHHFVPESGWTSFTVDSADDVNDGLWLLRISHLYRALTKRNKPEGREVLENTDLEAELSEMDVSDAVMEIFANVAELERQ